MTETNDSPSIPVGPEATFVAAFNGMANEVHRTAVDKGWWENPKLEAAVDHLMGTLPAADKPLTSDELRAQLAPFIPGRTEGDIIALIHSEVSEMLEGVRKPGPDRHCPWFDQRAVEAADVIIRIMDWARAYKVPVAEALISKARVNKQRGHRHGGKRL